MLVRVTERLHEGVGRPATCHVQRPHRTQAHVRARIGTEQAPQLLVRLRLQGAFRRAALQNHAGPARVPVALARLQPDELRVGHLAEIGVAALPLLGE